MRTVSAPSAADVREIANTEGDRILRNLRITQSYHDLSAAMTSLLGPRNGTWSMFGTWASKTAGSFIRGDEMPASVRRAVTSSPSVQERGGVLSHALEEVGHTAMTPLEAAEQLAGRLSVDVSLYIMQGNKVVFEEMGGAYARFLEVVGPDFDEESLARLLAEFEPGDVRPDAVTIDWSTRTITTERRGGQSLLREMLQQYALAMREPNAARRAQLVLYANALGGIHEQTRLQAYIEKSLDVPIDDLFREALHHSVSEREADPGWRHAAHVTIDRLVHPVADAVKRAWESSATAVLMSMQLPDGTLHLGRDVPAPPGASLFPPALATIDLPALEQVLLQYRALGRSEGAVAPGSRAIDWVSLSERMRYILELFRSRQQDPALLTPPFTNAQRSAIADGVVPQGKL